MAKLPALVTALAEIDGRERKTIDYVARTIRERDYITTEKRGSGAADMTIREAINLLIALNAADTPKDAPLAIDRNRSFVQVFAGDKGRLQEQIDRIDAATDPVRHIADARTFGEALERLLESVPALMRSFYDDLRNAFSDEPEERISSSMRPFIQHRLLGPEITFRGSSAKIEFFRPMTLAGTAFGFDTNKTRASTLAISYRPDFTGRGVDFYGVSPAQINNPADRHISIGLATMIQIYDVLGSADES